MNRSLAGVALAAAALLSAGCAHAPPDDPSDPLEPVNRAVYKFNETADYFVLRPVAKGYDKVTPQPVRTGVRNFFGNLTYPTVVVNDLLQLKVVQAGRDLARFVLNSTFGLLGVFDVATPGGLPPNSEDFGQTLGYWGLGEGMYLMLPFLGPSNGRDLIGRTVDSFTNPGFYYDRAEVTVPLGVLNLVDQRASLLPADKFLAQQLDRYVFIRTIYLQGRQAKVYDGAPPEEDYGFEMEADGAEPAGDGAPAEEEAPAEEAAPEQ
jgi:phospholipid-binding lipoprotein MlaA